ncbi:MAG: hypothetical protein J7L88_01900 [Thermoplasmata archaeon]|nr:hypothetical protein [Thermoplasmata archaeon]
MPSLIKVSRGWLKQAVPLLLLVVVSSTLLLLASKEEFRSNISAVSSGEEAEPPEAPVKGIIPEEEVSQVVPSGTKTVVYNESGENRTEVVPTGKGKAVSGILNGVVLVGIGAGSGLAFYLLLKKGFKRFLIVIFALLFLVISSLSTTMTVYLLLWGVGAWKDAMFNPLLLTSTIIAGLITWAIFTRKNLRPAALLIFSGVLGLFLAYSLPIYVVLPLSVAAALWDWRAAREGVIKRMVDLDLGEEVAIKGGEGSGYKRAAVRKREWPKLTDIGLYDAGEWQIGMGDLVLYTALGASIVRYFFVLLPAIGVSSLPGAIVLSLIITAGISIICLAGLIRTSYYVEVGGIFPALPFPVAGMTAFFLLYTMVLELLSVVQYGRLFPLI